MLFPQAPQVNVCPEMHSIRHMHSDLSKHHKLFSLLSRKIHHHFWHEHFFYLTSVKKQYAFFPCKGCLIIKFQEELLKQCR